MSKRTRDAWRRKHGNWAWDKAAADRIRGTSRARKLNRDGTVTDLPARDEAAPIRTCSLPDPVTFDLTCEHCGRQATVTLPLARLSATLRCSGCGMVALPF